MKRNLLFLLVLLLVVAVGLSACSDEEQEPVEVTRIVEVEVPGECEEVDALYTPRIVKIRPVTAGS